MEISIKVEDFLTKEEIREICIEELRIRFREEMRTMADAERVISNLTYSEVIGIVNNEWGIDLTAKLKKRMTDVICGDGSTLKFTMFKEPDAWSREAGKGWKILQEEMDNCRPLIREKVEQAVGDFNILREVKKAIMETFRDIVEESFERMEGDEE